MSRYENSLTMQLSEAVDSTARAVSTLRLASYRARKGQVQTSRAAIESIRKEFSSSGNPCIFARINLAESICEYFDNGLERALDKLRRSKLLASGCTHDADLQFEVSAWMASFMRILRRWGDFEHEISFLMENLEGLSPVVNCRAGLAIADSFQEIGEYQRADQWYARVRSSSLAVGDDSMFGASLYNRVAIRIYNLRLNAISGNNADLGGCKVDLEAATAKNYSHYVRDTGMSGAFDLLQGQLALLGGKFDTARELFEDAAVRSLVRDWPAVDLVMRADCLWIDRKDNSIALNDLFEQALDVYKMILASKSFGDAAISAKSLHFALQGVDDALSDECLKVAYLSLENFERDRARQMSVLNSLGL